MPATDLGILTIVNGGTVSNVMDFAGWKRGVSEVTISGPGTLTGVVKVQVSLDSGTTWADYQLSGADVTIPSDGAVNLEFINFDKLRLSSTLAEGAERIFQVNGS